MERVRKRKIDLGKSKDDDMVSCSPSTTSLFDDILSNMRAIKEFISGLLMGLGGPSIARHYYIAQIDYE